MKKNVFLTIVLLGILSVVLVACGKSNSHTSSTNDSPKTSKTAKNKKIALGKKSIIVFFSKPGINYEGYRKVGNTEVIARDIQKLTKSDMYQVVPKKPYPMKSYSAVEKRATAEQKNNARPAIKNPIPSMKKYKTVFIASPVWYSELPMVMRTFMDKTDLNGKTIIPVVTDFGSGFASIPDQIKKQYPKANVIDGFNVQGADVQKAQPQVKKFVDGLK
ncbi:flavodoxin [Lactobacillus johnsonii]|uniref:flavodoxin n=1 Tax=Lactobacillus johnsonii TaxID=33959 RepID=UPI003D7771F8